MCCFVNRIDAKHSNPLPARVLPLLPVPLFPDYRIICQKMYQNEKECVVQDSLTRDVTCWRSLLPITKYKVVFIAFLP